MCANDSGNTSMCMCTTVFFISVNCTCVSLDQLSFQGQRGEGSKKECLCVCVCVAEVAHAHGPEGVGTSSGMGSGRWSRGARCTATWSVGSAWLECRPCEPLGPRNLAPKLSPPHTPPKNTQKLTSVLSVPLPIDRLSFEEVRGQADGPAAWLQKKLMLNHPHRHTPIPAAVGCVLHVWNTHLELGGWICRCRL